MNSTTWKEALTGQIDGDMSEEIDIFETQIHLRKQEKIEEKLLDQFLQNMPQLKPFLDYVELSTPLFVKSCTATLPGTLFVVLSA